MFHNVRTCMEFKQVNKVYCLCYCTTVTCCCLCRVRHCRLNQIWHETRLFRRLSWVYLTALFKQPESVMMDKAPTYQVPLGWKGSPMERNGPYPEISLTCLPGSPLKELPPPEAPSTEPLQRQTLDPQISLHPSLKVCVRRALLQVPQTGPLWKEMPVSRAFCTYPSGSTGREPFQVPFTELSQRERLHLQSPFQPYLIVPGRWGQSSLPNWAPMRRDAHPQILLIMVCF
jgi:hypothetical protein